MSHARHSRFPALYLSLFVAVAPQLLGCQKKSSTPAAAAGQSSATSSDGKKIRPADDAPLLDAPSPPPVTRNPLSGAKLFVDPESLAMLQARRLATTDPAKAELVRKIADRPQGLWMGEWNSDIFRAVEHYVKRARADGSVPIIIAYDIPHRDCGQYSAGGIASADAYRRWIRSVAAGIGEDPAVVILEPDAIGHFQECLSEAQKSERMMLLHDAVKVLRQSPNTAVYLDAGHARWVPVDEIAARLKQAGVEDAHGFSLNTSNYVSTEENLDYGRKVSAALGGKHFVIDTSRNGAGPFEGATTAEQAWCNPPGRKLGHPPTTDTGEPLCDGFLWLKRPGESDGECNGGPKAGVWWESGALELAR